MTKPLSPLEKDPLYPFLDLLMREKFPTDLTPRAIGVMLLLKHASSNKERTTRRLAWQLRVQKPIITRVIVTLERLGMARQERDPADRRSVLHYLTEKAPVW